MSKPDYRLMSFDELTALLREKYNQLITHPYWENPNIPVFRSDIYPMLTEIWEIIYGFKNRYWKEFDDDHPFICMYTEAYHAFNSRLGNLRNYVKPSQVDCIKNYYVPMIQDYLNLIKSFLDGKTDSDSYTLRIPEWDSKIGDYTSFRLYKPIFKLSWVNSDGFDFYSCYGRSKDGAWHMKRCITGKEIKEVIKECNRLIKVYEKYLRRKNLSERDRISGEKSLNFNKACIKDIEEKTDFWYHVY